MAGILPDLFGVFGGSGHGVLPFGDAPAAPNPVDANRNAILGYLAGALQGGNLGQSIGRGLQGWLTGAQTDAAGETRRAAAQYVAQQPDIEAGMRSVLMQNPALATQYLQARMRPQIEIFLHDLATWASFDLSWTQRYAVEASSRMLYTLEGGEVISKRAALEWASEALPPEWHDLLEQVRDDRLVRWNDPPRPGSVDRAVAFVECVQARARGTF